MVIDVTYQEAIFIEGLLKKSVEYGYSIETTRILIDLYDRIRNTIEENSVNE